ncbi:MAG: UDP-N-acetyl-D-glucosamine dehydrogenase [Candidatus Binatota bacterium]|jgi:UDP-N-acetyl-D-glucosamine dehydrogenase|nr:UDP-N-acetyl-D-glucosamine dehydrogenase [Candidatus Binatota bacterium]
MNVTRESPVAGLKARFESRDATVGVIGLGYVGLPLACTMVEAGLRVAGFDVDPVKVEKLSRGESYIRHIGADRVRRVISSTAGVERLAAGASPGLVASADFSELRHCDAILVCVPTPLTEGREPDLSYVRSTAEAIAATLRPGQLVVLESTTYPGTTDEVVQPVLERGGLRAGRDFLLAFSPEREDPGNPSFSTRTIPKLVGGVTPACGEAATALYRAFLQDVIMVSHARIAESAKLLENIFRGVNIALVNELKMLFDRMDIDVWEVIDAAGTKPFGFMPFYPGPGLGGHCIPIDPFYLTWKARHYDFSTRFIELAGEINSAMPYYVVERVIEALGDRGRAIRDANVLVLGVAYKKDIDDLRESPSLRLLELLESKHAKVSYNDPYVPSLRARRLRHYDTFELDSVPLTPETLAAADCVLIATDHSDYDYAAIVESSRLVVDTRNATRSVTVGRDKIVKA